MILHFLAKNGFFKHISPNDKEKQGLNRYSILGRPMLRLLITNSLYNVHKILCDVLVAHPQNMIKPALVEGGVLSLLVILCCHLILRMLKRHRWWNALIFYYCTFDRVHILLPYIRLLQHRHDKQLYLCG